jgi:thioesterase domain-containing protein
MGSDQRIYGLQSRGITGDEPLPTSIPEIAADWLSRLRSIQPHGPYHLLGWSLGGVIAHEMAVQLQAVGEEVALLAMLDSFPIPTAWRANFTVEPRAVFVANVFQRYGELVEQHIDQLYRVFANNSVLGAEFTPGKFTGDATLFVATKEKPSHWPVPEDWAPYIDGRLDVYPLDCVHHEIAYPWALERIGAVLADLMRSRAAA